ncbi:MAG: DinB family protein [Bacteroidota bacterium]
MKASTQLANRFREVIHGKWIANTNLTEQLENVSLETAITQVHGLNTIAMLTFHIHYYIAGVLNVLEGGELTIRDKYSFDLPPMNEEEEWESLKNQLIQNADKFAEQVELLPDKKLDDIFVNKNYGDYRRNIDGIIEHTYYHLGQITLVKKLLEESKKSH